MSGAGESEDSIHADLVRPLRGSRWFCGALEIAGADARGEAERGFARA
jgi:hypothetical protein